MLGLCLPANSSTKPEYAALYPDAQQDAGSKDGRLELLRRINAQFKAWKDLLHRFLKSNDDQVRIRPSSHGVRPAAVAAAKAAASSLPPACT